VHGAYRSVAMAGGSPGGQHAISFGICRFRDRGRPDPYRLGHPGCCAGSAVGTPEAVARLRGTVSSRRIDGRSLAGLDHGRSEPSRRAFLHGRCDAAETRTPTARKRGGGSRHGSDSETATGHTAISARPRLSADRTRETELAGVRHSLAGDPGTPQSLRDQGGQRALADRGREFRSSGALGNVAMVDRRVSRSTLPLRVAGVLALRPRSISRACASPCDHRPRLRRQQDREP
jgi:hypothetical protein